MATFWVVKEKQIAGSVILSLYVGDEKPEQEQVLSSDSCTSF